jgi:hypothetical protein
MVIYSTIAPVGILTQGTYTIAPLQTFCSPAPPPGPIINSWLFGVTIAGQSNVSTVMTELQSLLVTLQFQPEYPTRSEGVFATPMLLGSVQLPGNTVR